MKPSRRDLVRRSLLLAGGTALSRILPAQPVHVDLVIFPDVIATVPHDFTGLGYEISSAARTGLLSAKNETYVRLVRQLGRHGVLRVGGIVADFSQYLAGGTSAHGPKHTVITRANLAELRGFLDATGWTAIWSVNFGSGTLPEAIEEARAVREILGPRLLALELGNEVDNYGHGTHPLRPSPYTFGEFRDEYRQWRAAILIAVPGLSFAAPDAAVDSGWLEQMAASAQGGVQLLTQHYYRGDQRKAILDQLLQPDPGLADQLARYRAASQKSGIPWRMCETNSFYGGGNPGLSDTLAGALWTLDFMLLLAESGCAGVNLETGFNQLGFLSSYSPIRNDEENHASVGAPYYGMLAFAETGAAGNTMFRAHFGEPQERISAYACSNVVAGTRSVTVINRSATPASLSVDGLSGPTFAMILDGPGPVSTSGIRLGNAAVNSRGEWQPPRSHATLPGHNARFTVPAFSAVVLRSRTTGRIE